MTKRQFLQKLSRKLLELKKADRKRYLDDYEEMILDQIENGLSEEKAIAGLGDIDVIAREILDNASPCERRRPDLPGRILVCVSLLLSVCSLAALVREFHIFHPFGTIGPFGNSYAVSVIGGADGPTSIFLAGKVSSSSILYVVTGLFLLITVIHFVRHRK